MSLCPEKRDLWLPIVSRVFSNHPPSFPIVLVIALKDWVGALRLQMVLVVPEESSMGLGG